MALIYRSTFDQRLYGVSYTAGAEVDVSSWSARQVVRVVDRGLLYPYDTDAITADLPGLLATVADLRYAKVVPPLLSPGDDIATLKAMIADGHRDLRLMSGQTYRILSSLGDDFLDINDTITLFCHGATVLLGNADGSGLGTAGLGRTADYVNDPTVGWAFYPNTHTAAVDGHAVVTTDATTQAAGAPFGASIHRLRIFGGVWDGQNNNVGIAFGNHAPILIDGIIWKRMAVPMAGEGYVDGMEIRRTHARSPRAGCWLLDTTDLGDTVILDGNKSDPGAGLWRAKQCRGGEVRAPLGGYQDYTNVDAVKVTSGHIESDQDAYTHSLVKVAGSKLEIEETMFYTSKTPGKYPILVQDVPTGTNGDDIGSTLILKAVIFRHLIRTNDLPDIPRSPDIYIASANLNTSIEFGVSGEIVAQGSSTATGAPVLVQSADAGVQAALDAVHGRVAGKQLSYRNGAWRVETIGAPPQILRAFVSPPALSSANVAANGVVGSYHPGDRLDYVTAPMDDQGNFGQMSAVQSTNSVGNVGTNGAVRIIITASVAGIHRLWKKNAAGVGTAPTAYVDLDLPVGTSWVFDTGVYVDGLPWITTGSPPGGAPNTVAAYNHATDGLMVADGARSDADARHTTPTAFLRWNMPRTATFTNLAPLVARQLFVTEIFLERGTPVSKITFYAGSQAVVTPAHQWAVLLDQATRVALGISDDLTTAAWAQFTGQDFTLKVGGVATPSVIPKSANYYLGLMVDAATPPSLQGVTHNNTVINNQPPIPCGKTGDTGLTTPPALPFTAQAISATFAGYALAGVK